MLWEVDAADISNIKNAYNTQKQAHNHSHQENEDVTKPYCEETMPNESFKDAGYFVLDHDGSESTWSLSYSVSVARNGGKRAEPVSMAL